LALAPVLEFAIEASQPQIDAKRHTLSVDIPGEPCWLDADPTRVSQVVSNLLNNAAKYTPEGGRIGLAARSVYGFVEIEVSDNGIGIPDHMQSKIFELFTQVRGPGAGPPDGPGHRAGSR